MKIRKEDMNKLVMNFLVTEGYVEAAEKFRNESGTERILEVFLSIFGLLVFMLFHSVLYCPACALDFYVSSLMDE